MSYTFICTPEKEWYLKIKNIEELLDYWNVVFNPKMEQALLTINDILSSTLTPSIVLEIPST